MLLGPAVGAEQEWYPSPNPSKALRPRPIESAGVGCESKWETIHRGVGRILAQHVEDISVPAQEIGDLAEQARRDYENFFSSLGKVDFFNGLYLRAQHERRLDSGDAGSSFALEWEAFENGRNEAGKRLDKSKLEQLVQQIQLQHDLQEKALHEALNRAQRMRNRILAREFDAEAGVLEEILQRRRQEMAAGFSTLEDVAELEFKLKRAQAQKSHYLGAGHLPLGPLEAGLLRQAESLALKPIDNLLARAIQHSWEHKLQSLFARRSEFYHTWSDDLSLRLYLEKRQDFDQASENVVGFRLRLPLDRDNGHEAVAELEKKLYATQQQAVEIRLRQKLQSAIDTVREKQAALQIGEAEVEWLRERGRLACVIAAHPVSVIDAVPDRTQDEIRILLREKSRDLLTLRFAIFEQLLVLAHLTQAERLTDLLAQTP